jgi:hypothetical protein
MGNPWQYLAQPCAVQFSKIMREMLESHEVYTSGRGTLRCHPLAGIEEINDLPKADGDDYFSAKCDSTPLLALSCSLVY